MQKPRGRTGWMSVLLAVALLGASCTSSDGDSERSSPTTAPAAPAVVASDDGGLTLEIPDGALPEGTDLADITITTLGAEDLPDVLAGADLRSAFYSLQPHGLEFLEPVTMTRRFAAADSGFDLSQGVPLAMLATSDPDGGEWDVPTNQLLRLDGDDVVLSGQLDHFSLAWAFGGSTAIGLSPDPVRAVEGTSGSTTVSISSPVQNIEYEIVDHEADPGIDIQAYDHFVLFDCLRPGTFRYQITVRLGEDYAPEAIAAGKLAIPVDQAEEEVVLVGIIECTAAPDEPAPPAAPPVELTSVEVCAIHTPLEAFRSFLRWTFTFGGDGVDTAQTTKFVVSNGANGGAPVSAPVEEGKATADSGIPAYGSYDLEQLVVQGTDGSTVDLTAAAQALLAEFGGVTVDANESCRTAP